MKKPYRIARVVESPDPANYWFNFKAYYPESLNAPKTSQNQ